MADQVPILLDVASVVELEHAIAEAGTPLAVLMERAGGAIADEVKRRIPPMVDVSADVTDGEQGMEQPAQILVLAGSGNNGGDGWVAANLLAAAGYDVMLVTPKAAPDIKAEPAHEWACRVASKAPENLRISVMPSEVQLKEYLTDADGVIDGLLGTGFSGSALRQPMDQWISLLREEQTRRQTLGLKPLRVIAADVPSGLSAQTGSAASSTVVADVTVTMIVGKPGLFATTAAPFVGELVVNDLGVDLSQFLATPLLRHGIPEDIDQLLDFYSLMIDETTDTDNDPMWVLGLHPSREGLSEAIAHQSLVVAEAFPDRKIIGATIIDQHWVVGYDQASWTIEATADEVWTLHLFAVHPAYQHQGIGSKLLKFTEAYGASQGGKALRIDVLASNDGSLRAYDAMGFSRIGLVQLTYDDPRVTDFILMEKALGESER